MCGLIGYITNGQNSNIDKKFDQYFKLQLHRGPDYQKKIKVNSNGNIICVGFSRLAIIDSGKSANKIFYNDKYILLFNGEIYNYRELKKKYLSNISFSTNTDTEVLFNLLINKNTDILSELEGMFSIVLINKHKNNILLARDYTGIKPLYYSIKNKDFFFSSEAWFQYSLSDKEIDYSKLGFFLKFGFNHFNSTIIKSVKKVSPGEYILYNFQTRNLTKKSIFNNIHLKKNQNLYKEEFLSLLENAIKKNLIADQNIGIFLSGGLDSSIVALMAKKFNPNIEAYTSYFEPKANFKKFNADLKFSQKISNELGIKLNKIAINLNDEKEKKQIINVISSFDEPLANFNSINSYYQSKAASNNNCKVILTGDGADELFGGYERYNKIYLAKIFRYLKVFNQKIGQINKLNNLELIEYFYNHIDYKKNSEIFDKNFDLRQLEYNKEEDIYLPKNNKIDCINYFDLKYWLPEQSNFKLDRTTMLNSVEARVPFQDVNLIKRIFTIPYNKKNNFFKKKIYLKDYINDVPDWLKKRKKLGWFSPESFYLRDYFKKLFLETFNKEDIKKQKIFSHEKVLEMYFNHFNKNKYFKNELLCLLSFQIWYNKILEL